MTDAPRLTLIDFENWERKEHYAHFMNEVRCSYSVCVNNTSERTAAVPCHAVAADSDSQ